MVQDVLAAEQLPTWDLTPFFPSLESPEFQAAFDETNRLVDELTGIFDEHLIGESWPGTAQQAPPVFDLIIERLTTIANRLETLVGYLYAIMSIDTRDETSQVRMSELDQRLVPLAQLSPRFEAWIGQLDRKALEQDSVSAREHTYFVEKARIGSRHLMTEAEESLAAELRPSSGNAWVRLYDNCSAQIMTEVEIDGEPRAMAMPEVRILAFDGRRSVRQAGLEAEIAAWSAHALPLAAALNGIKGEALTLLKRRRWSTALDQALFRNAIDRDVLDAMFTAARESYGDCRRYFAAKARLLGLPRMDWCDLFAPIDESSDSWTYHRSTSLIEETFERFSPRLGAMARRSREERWTDALPRSGKGDGAYCTGMGGDVSRIFMNFAASYSQMATLAHELGHAYHNVALSERLALQRETPSSLAETASIFCEKLVRDAAIEAEPDQELAILEGALQDSTQVIVDISSRFLFEQRLFEARKEHDVSVSELCSLMTETQVETYGDGLDRDSLHAYMWAAKGHYYSVDDGFYNFPYMFGLLFSLGLFGLYREEPAGFPKRYHGLLSSTGLMSAPDLAGTVGLDLRSLEFWRAGVDRVRADIDRYVELAERKLE